MNTVSEKRSFNTQHVLSFYVGVADDTSEQKFIQVNFIYVHLFHPVIKYCYQYESAKWFEYGSSANGVFGLLYKEEKRVIDRRLHHNAVTAP